jgi:hypothetical protein
MMRLRGGRYEAEDRGMDTESTAHQFILIMWLSGQGVAGHPDRLCCDSACRLDMLEAGRALNLTSLSPH